jgi:long-subunit fatty acid transport protein
MKKLLLITALCFVGIVNSQTLSYNDIGVLFTNERIDGTARFNGMSGAFGSLGGDLSAIDINPAGAAVFLKSEISFSLDFNGIDTRANYYGNNSYSSSDDVVFSQSGGVFVFRKNYGNTPDSGWGKVALAFNYSQLNNYDNFWFAQGNSNFPTWINDPYLENKIYPFSDGQYFENYTSGRNNKYTFSFASEYNNKLYIGAAFSTYNANFYQQVVIEEDNYALNGDELLVNSIQELGTYGDGFSFNLGIIGRPTENLRLGIAYQSPIWYNMYENFIEYDTEIYLSNVDDYYTEYSGISEYYYKLRTPSKFTGSASFIFDKAGLISFDYIYRNYSNIQLSDGNWNFENQEFKIGLNATSEVRVGTEWRVQKFSVRGGYHFAQNPYKTANSSDNNQGYSLGLGYNFGPVRFDFSYLNSSQTGTYTVYPQYPDVNPTELDYKMDKFTATLVINI